MNMQTAVKETKIYTNLQSREIENTFLESAIGNTPLIRLRTITKDLPENVEIYAKAEFMNPGGSVKDRAALAMILAGEKSGELTRSKTILDERCAPAKQGRAQPNVSSIMHAADDAPSD